MAFLEMRHITKRFKNVIANEDVSFQVEKGEVHALLGENGAGKSTLMNILYGMYEPTEGEIFLEDKKIRIKDPKDAIDQGIGMVHQHFMLIPALSVIENVILGMKDNKAILDLEIAAKKFTKMASKYNMEIDPWKKVEELSIGEQQRLEILKLLYRNAKLLIFDEPTAVLTPGEVEFLFNVIRQLTAEGHTVIFISHKLAEIMEICDCCTVLRQGKVEATVLIKDVTDKQHLASLMVGKNVDLITNKEESKPGKVVLKVENLDYHNSNHLKVLENINLEIRSGEILGISGVDGNGQSELIQCITGLKKSSSGKVLIKGNDCTRYNVKQVLNKGVAHIPEDRHKMGMIKEMSIKENLILMSYDKSPYSRKTILDWKWINQHSEKLCTLYNVKTPSIDEISGNLSGGNQQKFVVARELDRDPDLLIAMHPSRGLDIGATKYIQSQIIKYRDKGAAVLLVSTELDEILEISDRIVVMFDGKIMGTLKQKEANRDELGLLMAGVL